MEIFKLFGSILVNTDEADKSMQKTDSKAKGIATTLGNGVKTAAKWGTAIVGGATAAATGLVAFASKSAAAADNVDKMSQKIGISRQAYQELGFICSQSGTDVDKLQAGMKTMVGVMDGAASGTKSSIETFEKLGISATDASGNLRNSEDVMFEAMSALQGMENQTEKSRLATELFGKSGTELMPLLNGASGSIDAMKQQAHDLGLVLSDDMVDSGVKMTDTMDQLKRSATAVATKLGGSLMPIVQKVAQRIIDAMPKIQKLFDKLQPVATKLLDNLLPPLMDMARQLLPALISLVSSLIPFISDIAQNILPVFVGVISEIMPTLIELIQQIMPILIQLFSSIMPIVGELAKSLMPPLIEVFNALMPPILQLISALIPPLCDLLTMIVPIVNALTPVIAALASVFSDRLTSAINSVMPVIDNIVGYFKNVIDFVKNVFTGNWEEAWKNVVGIFENIFGGIVNVIKIPLNTVIDAINSVFSSLGELKIPKWVPKIGGESFSLPQIPRLARGGLAYGETLTTVGDNANANIDPEVIAPLSKLESIMGSGSRETDRLLAAILDQLKNLNIITQYIDQTKKTDPQDICRLSEALGFEKSRQDASVGAW